jgi:hypothetical protein
VILNNVFLRASVQILDGVGMQRVIDSMKRLHLLRREEIYAVAYWIKMRLCSGAAAP